MADSAFDILIIGSGPGGYVTAIRAAQLGFKTAIVEREYLGGICLNWGCIPTKALLRSAEIFHYLQHAKDYGLSAGEVTYDPAAVVKRSRAVSKRLNDGVGFLMKKNKVTVIWGEAIIDAPGKITVKDGKSEAPKGALGPGAYQAKHIIIATGARPRVLPGLEPDQTLIWPYFEACGPRTALRDAGAAKDFYTGGTRRPRATIRSGQGGNRWDLSRRSPTIFSALEDLLQYSQLSRRSPTIFSAFLEDLLQYSQPSRRSPTIFSAFLEDLLQYSQLLEDLLQYSP